MQVKITNYTHNPIEHIAICAGMSYGKSNASMNRVKACFNAGHMSVFEHVSVTFEIRGISRACSHQLVRHRLASFTQKSQRYTKVDTSADWFVVPPDMPIVELNLMSNVFGNCAWTYNRMIESGVRPEDARYILPEATKTDIVATMNLRELFHFFDLRIDKAAHWEIRNLAKQMLAELAGVDGFAPLVEMYKSKRVDEAERPEDER